MLYNFSFIYPTYSQISIVNTMGVGYNWKKKIICILGFYNFFVTKYQMEGGRRRYIVLLKKQRDV